MVGSYESCIMVMYSLLLRVVSVLLVRTVMRFQDTINEELDTRSFILTLFIFLSSTTLISGIYRFIYQYDRNPCPDAVYFPLSLYTNCLALSVCVLV